MVLRKARSLYALAWAPGGQSAGEWMQRKQAQQPLRKEKLSRFQKGTWVPMVLLCADDMLQYTGRKTLLQVGTGKPVYEVKRLGNWGSCSAWGLCKHVCEWSNLKRWWNQWGNTKWKRESSNTSSRKQEGSKLPYIFPSVTIAGRNLRRDRVFCASDSSTRKKKNLISELLLMPKRLRINPLDMK